MQPMLPQATVIILQSSIVPEVNNNHWFIRTNVKDGLKHYKRVALSFDQDNDFDTYNLKAKGRERYSFGWTDPRALYGSEAP